jgi:hypothetical protein
VIRRASSRSPSDSALHTDPSVSPWRRAAEARELAIGIDYGAGTNPAMLVPLDVERGNRAERAPGKRLGELFEFLLILPCLPAGWFPLIA